MTTVWRAPVSPGPLDATIRIPGSKSLTARFLYLAAVADSPTLVRGALVSRDTALICDALRSLGARIEDHGDSVLVTPFVPGTHAGADIDCGLAGTVMRFLPPLAALSPAPTRFDGDEAARLRPLSPLLSALERLGASIEYEGEAGLLPFTIRGPVKAPNSPIRVDASSSSQFLSALLLVAPLLPGATTVSTVGRVVSLPHVEMTVEALRSRGIDITSVVSQDGARSWRVLPGLPTGGEVGVEPDLSNAGPFLAAALVCGGRVSVPNWPARTSQAGDAWRTILADMGADVRFSSGVLTVSGPGAGAYHGADIDMSEIGELAPTLAALAALADSPTRITGIAHLRGHETDRLAALESELTRLGARVTALPDGLEIRPEPLRPTLLHAYGDHRMATFAAIIGLRVEGVELDDVSATSKTLPEFPRMWADLVRQPEVA